MDPVIPVPPDLAQQVERALEEDIGCGDLTAALIPQTSHGRASVITRESAILCGRPYVDAAFARIDPSVRVDWQLAEGARAAPDQRLFSVEGPARSLLTVERTALNFLQLLSGTATAVHAYAQRLLGTGCRLLDTRKTLPGLRTAQKYAVRVGGGHNHRMGLFDGILIKENHIAAAGSIARAIAAARATGAKVPVEVEVENLDELQQAIDAQADIAMLDDFPLEMLGRAVAQNRAAPRPLALEASGGVTLETIRAIADTGVDYVSVGSITKHVRAVDLSMRFVFRIEDLIMDARRKAALTFILVTVLIDILAFGMIIPVLPLLVQNFVGGSASRAAEIYGVFGTAWALMQLICAPLQGALSDRFGRRPVILISCAGLGLDFILMALAPNLWWLFVGRLISGITAASFSTAGAYIADVTPPEQRAAAFGLMGAAFGVGFVLGPALGGLLVTVSPRMPFWASAAMALANVGWGLFVLPESLPPERRVAFSWKNAHPFGAMRLLRGHPMLTGLASSYFLLNLAHVVLPSVTVLYMHFRYGWDTPAVGLLLAGVGVSSLIVQGVLVKPLVKWLTERRAIVVGLACGAAGFAIYGLAASGPMFWVGVPVMALWGIATPSLQTLMTRLVDGTEQGRLQGALASLTGLASLIGPTLFTQTFAASIGTPSSWTLPGAPFLLAAAIVLMAMFVAWRTTRPAVAAAAGEAA